MRLFKTFISIHKHVKVRATKYFALLVLAIISLFLQAFMHNYNIVYIMMFFLVSVALASTFFGMLNLYYLDLKYLSHTRFFADEKGTLTLLASNTSEHPLYDLNFSYKDEIYKIDAIKPHEGKSVIFDTVFEKRGRYPLGIVRVESHFPLVHERKYRNFELEENSVIVYPRPFGIPLLKRLSSKKYKHGDINDFKGVSRFVEGENISLIHWASLAKTDTLMSKQFSYTQMQEKLHFSYDELTGDTESRLSQLTLWVVEASQFGYAFTLEIKNREYDSKREDIDAILTQLALY